MKQIRQKKQAHHDSIRKEHLTNYFKQIRMKLINNTFPQNQHDNQNSNRIKIKKIHQIILNQNQIIYEINNNDFLLSLKQCIQKACFQNDLEQKNNLLIIITNLLKTNLKIHHTQYIVRQSFKLIQSLNILHLDLSKRIQSLKFKQILTEIEPAVLLYYIAEIFRLYIWLDEQDQIWIEFNLYGMFVQILFFVIKSNLPFNFYRQFVQQSERCFNKFFVQNQQPYQMGNKMKAQRNINLFIQILSNHYQIIQKNNQFPKKFQRIEAKLYWFYHYLSSYADQIKPLLQKREFLALIFQQLNNRNERSQNYSVKIKKSCYSLLRTFLDYDIFLQQINQFMLKVSLFDKNESGFQLILNSLNNEKESYYEGLQLIQGLTLHFCQRKQFQEIIWNDWKKIIQLCLKQIEQFNNNNFYNFSTHKSTLIKVLSILKLLIDYGNRTQNLSTQINCFLIYFQSMKGFLQLEQLQIIIDQNGQESDSDIFQQSQICKLTSEFIYIFFPIFIITFQFKSYNKKIKQRMLFILHDDKSIYEYYFNQIEQPIKQIFLVHSALDTVDYTLEKKRDYYLGQIKNQQLLMFAFVNPNLIRFVLVLGSQFKKDIDKKVDATIRDFFVKINQQLALAMLNPLYKVNQPITSKKFDDKVKNLVRDYLKMFLSDKRK